MSPETILDLIAGRRSTRDGFVDRLVPMPVLERIVQCGLAAPASKAAPPWRFTVVTDRGLLQQIAASVANAGGIEDFRPHDPRTGRPHPRWTSTVLESASILHQVPAAIFLHNAGPFSGGRQAMLDADSAARSLASFGYELELVGLGAALENMWLAAIAQGVSAVFMGDITVCDFGDDSPFAGSGDLIGALALGYAANEDRPRRPSDLPLHLVTWL